MHISKTRQISAYVFSNLLEVLCIGLYLYGITAPANILPFYLSVAFAISVLATVLVVFTFCFIKYGSEDIKTDYSSIKTYNSPIPSTVVVILEVIFVTIYATLAWYYCATISLLSLMLSLLIRNLVSECKKALIESE
jgi:hypothetical protein